MDRCAASYKMYNDVGKHFLQKLAGEVSQTEFCLNIEETTNTKQEKMCGSSCKFFSKAGNEIVVCHLESFKVTRGDAQSMIQKTEDFQEISWCMSYLTRITPCGKEKRTGDTPLRA